MRLAQLGRGAGIMICGTFGPDGDSADSFAAAVDFAEENRFFPANFNPLTPTPATPLLARLRREGRTTRTSSGAKSPKSLTAGGLKMFSG